MKHFLWLTALLTNLSPVVCAAPVQELKFSKVMDLPVAPGVAPGADYRELIFGPYFYGPVDFDVSAEGGVFVVDSQSQDKAIMRLNWKGQVLDRFIAKDSQGDFLKPRFVTAIGHKAYAYYDKENRIRVWQAGKPTPLRSTPVRLPLWAQPNWHNTVSRFWATSSGVCFVSVSVRSLRTGHSTAHLFGIDQQGQTKRIGEVEGEVFFSPSSVSYRLVEHQHQDPKSGNFTYVTRNLLIRQSNSKNEKRVDLPSTKSTMDSLSLICADERGTVYLWQRRSKADGDGYILLSPELLRVSAAGQITAMGSKPRHTRWWTTRRERVGPSGALYVIYPVNPNAPKGDKVNFALGKYE